MDPVVVSLAGTGGECHLLDVGASVECGIIVGSHCVDADGDGELPESGAVTERIVTDGGYGVGDDDGCEGGASGERTATDGGDGVGDDVRL